MSISTRFCLVLMKRGNSRIFPETFEWVNWFCFRNQGKYNYYYYEWVLSSCPFHRYIVASFNRCASSFWIRMKIHNLKMHENIRNVLTYNLSTGILGRWKSGQLLLLQHRLLSSALQAACTFYLKICGHGFVYRCLHPKFSTSSCYFVWVALQEYFGVTWMHHIGHYVVSVNKMFFASS